MRSFLRSRVGFTLVELLVVIGIIALLIGILLPTLSRAQHASRSLKSLSNLRQIGLGLQFYINQYRVYPAATDEHANPKERWADKLFVFMKNTEVYMSPQLTDADRVRMNKPFIHTTDPAGNPTPGTIFFGGYGYNYQYLGNGRTMSFALKPYHATTTSVRASAQTIAVADTDGSRNGTAFFTSEGVYVVDPPLGSVGLGSKGSRRTAPAPGAPGNLNSYYRPGNDAHRYAQRSHPAARNVGGKVNVLFCDGHAEPMALKDMDDFNNDGVLDNGWWNGRADATLK